jgi:hypothetical protein
VRAPDIQFVPRPATLRTLGLTLLVAGVAAVSFSLWQYVLAATELERIEAEILSTSGAATRQRSAPAAQAATRVSARKVIAINGAIARLNIPWGELFAAFEADKPKDVALLALLPDARKRRLMVQAEAANPQAMIDFVERLRAVPLFEEAFLVKHERRDQDAAHPYRFALEVRWKEER